MTPPYTPLNEAQIDEIRTFLNAIHLCVERPNLPHCDDDIALLLEQLAAARMAALEINYALGDVQRLIHRLYISNIIPDPDLVTIAPARRRFGVDDL